MDVLSDLGRLGEHKKDREILEGKTQTGLQLQKAEESNGTSSAFRHQLGGMHQDQEVHQCGWH